LALVVVPTFAIPAEPDGSFEIINLNEAAELSYISNLKLVDNPSNNKTLYFTADRGVSNIYTAYFQVGGGPETFVADGISPFRSDNLHAFMTFDISVPNIVGPAFHLPPLSVQNVVGEKMSSVTTFPGYNFVSVTITPTTAPNQAYVYLAGWDTALTNNAFVVARSIVSIGSSDILTPITSSDVIYLPTSGCYDQYDEKIHPQLILLQDFLLVIIPGKCGSFARITLPAQGLPFNSSALIYKDPKEDLFSFVSSAAFDATSSLIYYTHKSFNSPTSLVYSFNTQVWNQPVMLRMNLTEMERDVDLIIVIARSTTANHLVIIGSGTDRVERYTMADDGSLSNQASTLLEDEVDSTYSAFYYDPYIYMATYEPDGKLARLHINNFCNLWCTSNGYCRDASCVCKRGYTPDATQGCVASETPAPSNSSDATVVSLAVVTGVAIVIAIVGWILWFMNKPNYQQIK